MGGHVEAEDPASIYLLRGWKGDEDEDVDVESSEGSSEGEIQGLKRQAGAISTGVNSKKWLDIVETSAQETSDVGGQECDSSVAKSRTQMGRTLRELEHVRNNASSAKGVNIKEVVDEHGAVFLPGESSSMKGFSRLQPRKLKDGKRLDARKFRDHFAAKLIGSKKLNIAEGAGNEQGESGGTSKDKVILKSTLEHSGGQSPTTRAGSRAVISSSSEHEEETVMLHVNLEVEQEKGTDLSLNGDCNNKEFSHIFTRKRKQLSEGATQDVEKDVQGLVGQNKNGIQIDRTIVESEKDSETRSYKGDMTLDSSKSEDVNISGRSKRARKHNRQTDYIPWSDFGRLSVKKSESSKPEAFIDSASGTDTDCRLNGSKSLEKGPEASVNSRSKETRVTVVNSACEDVGSIEQIDVDHPKDSPSPGRINIPEKEQSTLLHANQRVLSHPATGDEELTILHERSPRSSNVQDIDIQQSQEVDNTIMQDKSVKCCGNASGPLELPETGSMRGTEVSQSKARVDSDPDAKEKEQIMNIGQSASSEMHLRKEPRLSMTEGAERDITSNNHQERTGSLKSMTVDDHDSVCRKCQREGQLICCDGKNCKVTFHIDCLDPPLMDVPPNDWFCPDCVYRRVVGGMHCVSKGIESIWDVKEGILDDGSLSSKGCFLQTMSKLHQQKLHENHPVGEGLGAKKQAEAEHDLTTLKMVQDNDSQNQCISPPITIGSANDTCPVQKSSSNVSCPEKLYFVKYKGVAHVHNIWLPESQVLKEAPKLLHTFKKQVEQGKAPRWDPEWAKPFRVIGKRKTMLAKRMDLLPTCEEALEVGHCVEWCIKWKKLGYEFCTWEPADRMPLKSAYSKKLIENYEIRSAKANRRNQSGNTLKAGALSNRRVQPDWILDEGQPEVIGKLLCNWQKHMHGIVVNEMHQDRIRITVGFLVCLLEQFEVTKPCLVVVPPPLVAEWKAAFQKWMPTSNVVLYAGSKKARRIIQRYEFYNQDGSCMVQIALTSSDTLNLDVEILRGLGLEALIIDECQRLKGTKTSKSLRQFGSSYRLLLFSEPLKDTPDDYHHPLALLSSCNDLTKEKDCISHEENVTLAQLKATVSKHIIQESKQDISSPKEFWVPVKMTAFQVEQYCKLLIDKCDMLARNKRGDIASSPHELLLKIRELCNHPFLVNPSFQESLTNLSPKELLDFGIGASGKLKLLDMMLCEAKSSQKRVVIITQIHLRVEKVSQMDILDDYMRQQFGIDSYERIDGGVEKSKKSAAVQRFNALDSKCFVFLLDRRACGPSIKLRSVNCIVIFDSDWNPQTDIQALLRMHSCAELEHMAICRFYCPHTIEERVLIAARNHSDLEANHHNFTQNLCQKLLRWGAHKNFELFDSISRDKDKVKLTDELMYSTEFINHFLGKDVVQSTHELCATYPHWRKALCPRRAGQYNKGLPLFGEKNEELAEEETVSAPEFWSDLLRDRQVEAPDGQVRELRARKKVQYHEDSFNTANTTQGSLEEEEESRRKRRRVAESLDNNSVGKGAKSTPAERLSALGSDIPNGVSRAEGSERAQSSRLCDNVERVASQRLKAGPVEAEQLVSGLENAHGNKTVSENRVPQGGLESSGNEGTNEPTVGAKSEQQQLLLSMKVDLENLCQALQFQADTAGHVEQLLFSVGNFFKLPKERSLLHAIELSLCWLAAEQQHYSIDRQATLALAEACFGVPLDKIDTVYAKLEERWKKRLEQGAQQSLASRGQDNEVSYRGDQEPTGNQYSNNLRDKHSLSQVPANLGSLEDPRIVGNVQKGQEASAPSDAHLLKQGPVNSVILDTQQVSASCESTALPNHLEGQVSTEQVQVSAGLQGAVVLQEPPTDVHRVSLSQQQMSINDKQRSERVQALINTQKTQIRSIDLLERKYKQKLNQNYESALLKLLSSRAVQSTEHIKLLEGLRSASNALSASFTLIRQKLSKKHQEDRGKEYRLITAQLDRSNAGEEVNPTTFESFDLDFNEKSIFDSLPPGLKAALEFGDFGSVPASFNTVSQSSFAPRAVEHQSLSLAPDSGTSPPAVLPSLGLSEPQIPVASGQHQQRHLSQGGQQQRRPSVLPNDHIQSQLLVTSSGLQEQQRQHAQPQQRLPVTHPQSPLTSASLPLPPAPTQSSPIPLPPQPQPQSQPPPPFTRQPQLLSEVQQTQALQGGDAIPARHGHQHISGPALAHPHEVSQSLSISATHQQAISHASSVRGNSAGISTSNRIQQNVQARTNQQYQNDPLAQEFLRMRKEQEKIKSAHEVEKDRIKAQFMKELEVLSKKYEAMLQEEDSVYTQRATALELNLKKVEMNRRLAEVFRLKNSQDSCSVNSSTFGQDVRALTGASQGQNYQQHPSFMSARASFAAATPALPQISPIGMVSMPSFERPALAPASNLAGPQLAGTQTNVSWHYSQGRSTTTIPGPCSQSAHAGSLAGPIAGQSRLVMNAAGPSSHTEGTNLLAARVSTQTSGPINTSVQRSLPSVAGIVSNSFPNSPVGSTSPAATDFPNPNLASVGSFPQATSSQPADGVHSGRFPTNNVQTYATSVTPQCNITSQIPGDSATSQMHTGLPQDSYGSLGILMPLPELSMNAIDGTACDSFAMERLGPPFVNNEEFQADGNRCMISATNGNSGQANQDMPTQTPFQSINVQNHVINGLGSTHGRQFDEGRNNGPSDVICLSDDD